MHVAKIQTREEKFRAYREAIKNGPDEIVIKTKVEKVPEVSVPKKSSNKQKNICVNKHVYDKKEREKVVKQKTIYDEYIVRRRLKRFLYVFSVLALMAGLIALLYFVIKNFM